MSRLLADTHAALWALADDPKLSEPARGAIVDPSNEVLVSIASLWEISIKRATGKLRAPAELPEEIVAAGFTLLPIAPEHAWAAGGLQAHHGDPFDRLLVAQALTERLVVITRDDRFGAYGVESLW